MVNPNALQDFLQHLRDAGNSEATIEFVRDIAGEEVDRAMFRIRYKAARKTRCPPSKANHLFEYLVACRIIRSNER